VDAPVERKLEGPPIEASASRSVFACSGPCRGFGAQDVYSGAHGDSFLSFRIGRGRVVSGGRRQCVVVVSCGSSEVARPWLRRSPSGHSVALDVGPLLAGPALPCKLHQFPQGLVSSTSSLFPHLQTVSSFLFLFSLFALVSLSCPSCLASSVSAACHASYHELPSFVQVHEP
jgi:hypothetical protein